MLKSKERRPLVLTHLYPVFPLDKTCMAIYLHFSFMFYPCNVLLLVLCAALCRFQFDVSSPAGERSRFIVLAENRIHVGVGLFNESGPRLSACPACSADRPLLAHSKCIQLLGAVSIYFISVFDCLWIYDLVK